MDDFARKTFPSLPRLARYTLACSLLCLSACQSSPNNDNDKSIAPSAGLTGITWRLTRFVTADIPTSGQTNLMLTRDAGRISGSAGCNRYFGSYQRQGQQLRFSQIGATKMQCMNMTEENHFFKAIQQVNRFRIENHRLTLFHDQQPLMTFERQPETP